MKKIISLLLSLVMALSFVVTIVSAEEDYGVAPCLNNTANANTVFIIEDGIAGVSVWYSGYEGICTGATITTKLEKRFLLVFWKDVDLGTEGDVWVDESTNYFYHGYHEIAVSKGTYRATVTYVIRGTGGPDDVLTAEIEDTY